ncbi:nickel pincer cofactor biosynthesis protein LarC [Gracilibacillus sp. YIM 98692]|uniref:nickel pincer cofactor biosynthesis protein LarC n=1 Tax=Gracilibacillus sp. YIM 98692 TaxID=2663532 RepID=UPI0013D2E540|nr:nickel pincer cofactor biosynthesis protein LarC [Gracilibacillus sp. YIM 98692]
MRTLYIDCFSGISGDMTIASLLDLGLDFDYLKEQLQKLRLEQEYELTLSNVVKNGISSLKFDVQFEEHHHHRTYKDIVKMIDDSTLNDQIKKLSKEMFRVIGEAEGKIHGVELDRVHFHEVGAIDSIIDIVGTAILIDQLQLDQIISSAVPVGSGNIHIDHGIYPVPAPATLEVLKDVPLKNSDVQGELTTPTGAAIIKVLAQEISNIPNMTVQEVGYGAGTKTFDDHPNVLRTMIGTI